jgi:putative transposase
MERILPHRRPHYPPIERLAILELRAARGWSLAQTARQMLVTPLTVASWTRRLDDEGPAALIQLREPVNRFPEFVGYLVRRLKVHSPSLGSRRIARLLARAGLHLGATTVRKMLKPSPKPTPIPTRSIAARIVTAKRPNHVWHADLTTVPTSLGYWTSWLPFAMPPRWPFCWWVAAVVDHYSRRVMGTAIFESEPAAADVSRLVGLVCRSLRCRSAHLITDHGVQFTADAFHRWCRRHRVQQRFGAIGKYGSLAVIERFIRSLKNECTRAILVPFSRRPFAAEIDFYVAWFNAHRPHGRLGARTPDEVYFGTMPACRKPRFEPRPRWPRRSPCAQPQALVRGRPGAVVELHVGYYARRKHLPLVTLKRVA